MPATVKNKSLKADHPLVVLNFDHLRYPKEQRAQRQPTHLVKQRVVKKLATVYFQNGGARRVLVLSDTPDDIGMPLSKSLTEDDFFGDLGLNLTVEEYAGGEVTHPNQAGVFKGDNTKPLPLPNDAFSLVVGRAIICFCGTSFRACGIPDNLSGFLREVIRVLKPGGVALLHGDHTSDKPQAMKSWQEAVMEIAPGYSSSLHITLFEAGGYLRGIKLHKTIPKEPEKPAVARQPPRPPAKKPAK